MVKEFFDTIRPLFPGGLKQTQVEGINAILSGFGKYGNGDVNTLAYNLATAWWETAKTMQPIKETYRPSDGDNPTDNLVIARLNGAFAAGKLKWVKTPYWRNGWFGRGLVQLTHEDNYKGKIREAVLKEFGVDIHKNRDAVMNMPIAVFILVRGMIEGWFTGKDTGDYIDNIDESDAEDYKEYLGARRTVNGTDRAKEIADAALVFEKAIRAQELVEVTPVPPKLPEPAVSSETYVPTSQLPWWVWPVVLVGAGAVAATAALFFR